MADRTVKVTLLMQASGYMQGVSAAQKKTAEFGSEAEKLTQKREAFKQLGASALTMGGVVGVGIGVAVSKFADFDQAMSNVAATGADARGSLDALREAAIEAGARTVFSAEESANAIEEMAKAGVDAKDILGGGLSGALDLAAAGGLGVADAAGIAATALKVFNLEGSDMSHVADLLAAGAGKAMGDVSDLSQALAQGGQVAAATGLSIEETTAALASFASQGLLGSDAGTSLKTMLQRLTPQSKEAQKQFDALGISAYDANGQFIGLAEFSGKLQTAMADMSPEARNAAMSVMFGSDAVRAANVLFKEGEAGIREWITAVDDQGYAAETARTRLDNLKGDWEALTGAVDSALITMGEGANGPLRFFTQALTDVVSGFSGLPTWAQQSALGVGALASAAGVAGGGFLLAISKLAEFNAAIATMPVGAQRASRALGVLAKSAGALAAVAVGLSLIDPAKQWISDTLGYTDAVNKAVSGTKTLEESIESLGTKGDVVNLENLSSAFAGLSTLDSNWFSRFTSDFDSSVSAGIRLQSVLGDLGKEIGTLAASNLPAAQAQFRAWGEATNGSDEQLRALLNSMPEYRNALDAVLQQQGLAVNDTNRLNYALGETPGVVVDNTDALRELQGQAEATGGEIDGLADKIRKFGTVTLDAREAGRQFEAAFDDLSDSIKENGNSLDTSTAKGRANEAALDAIADSTFKYSAALYDQTGSQTEANAVIAKGRERLIDMLAQLGITGREAQDYADKLELIPDNVNTAVRVETEAAQNSINRIIENNNGRRITLNVVTKETRVSFSGSGNVASSNYMGGMYEHGKVKAFAAGGFASGIYPGREGGIHKFAEGHLPWETYISPDPMYRERNLDIWAETGRRLGAYQPDPASHLPFPVAQSAPEEPRVQVIQNGDNYSYDPTSIAKQQALQLGRALDAAGLTTGY
ncbi:phage tail tape measure protein [Microbacterium aquilitoris]|uniref:phage tail tape measure protein n=1 Tax=Microbacterium aquilitoris TaxID=3067307 RepID=UPI0028925556|nr:phage tail tape measure protein [Microbacterium sp. KSW2-22]MDT3343881.1 phage tail tape measure protein [Microbacterium sp. KSW2-22]